MTTGCSLGYHPSFFPPPSVLRAKPSMLNMASAGSCAPSTIPRPAAQGQGRRPAPTHALRLRACRLLQEVRAAARRGLELSTLGRDLAHDDDDEQCADGCGCGARHRGDV
ncbi:hypothetical protein JB92DRAFT_1747672 [Gautieria morchelliformis]|nr:hypothetical protein JB92DRAFT_1747672 [Gautieria morchelliformis]